MGVDIREYVRRAPQLLKLLSEGAGEAAKAIKSLPQPARDFAICCVAAGFATVVVVQALGAPGVTSGKAVGAAANIQVLAVPKTAEGSAVNGFGSGDVAPLSWSPELLTESEENKGYDVKLVALERGLELRPSLETGIDQLDAPFPQQGDDLAIPSVNGGATEEQTVRIGRGDTLGEVLTDAGAAQQDAHYAVRALAPHLNPRRLQVGQEVFLTFETTYDEEGRENVKLTRMAINTDVDRQVVVTLGEDNQYTSKLIINELMEGHLRARGTIDNSLYLTALELGLPDQVIAELIRIFSFDIDFQRDIRKGDTFEVFYSRFYDDEGKALRNGAIHYAALTVQGKARAYYRFRPSDDGIVDYFDASGQSAKKFLMRTPVEGARLSSNYGRRKHPILGYTRMHKGVDFAAPRGTPIMAAGRGVVEMAQRWGSFGNYIRIRHNGTYSTAYAHLHRFARGIRKGVRVRQGQTIGYVGSTGRATGPHLHYEVLMHKKQVNPRTIKVPTGRKLGGNMLAAFKGERSRIDLAMEGTPVTTLVAAAPPRLIENAGCASSDTGELLTC